MPMVIILSNHISVIVARGNPIPQNSLRAKDKLRRVDFVVLIWFDELLSECKLQVFL